MKFYPNQLFHIYNQGNNKRIIFLDDENYEFFIWKMRAYLLPFGELIGWCLMPNHYHWQFYVRQVEIKRKTLWAHIDKVEYQRRVKKYGDKAMPVEFHKTRKGNPDDIVSLNEAIGMLQASYSRAINRENNWTGSLFRASFKSKDGWIDGFVTIDMWKKANDFRFLPGTDYAYTLLIYIHQNPVKANLVVKDIDWKYSSARDYAGLRKGNICNLELGKQLLQFV
jgi:putative transposase